jgi:hypothetical protein
MWYIAETLPVPRTYTQGITAAIAWYIWKGSVFKVPITTPQRPKSMGGWEMTHTEAKCSALLLCRMCTQSRKEGTITAEWLLKWKLSNEQENPPQSWKPLEKLKYLQVYALDMPYIQYDNIKEKIAKLRQHKYRQLQMMVQARTGIKDMWIETMYPNTQ